MSALTLVSKIKTGVLLLVLFPLITLALLAALQPIPLLGRLAAAAAFFSAPGIWLLAAIRKIHTASPLETIAALSLHYPILGFLSGYLFPFEVTFTRTCAKHIAVRYGLFILGVVAIGMALALYAVARDS